MDTGPPSRAVRITPQLMLGLFIILIGVVFTLDSLELLAAERFLRYWPAGLIVIGAAKLWQTHSRSGSSQGGMLFLVAGGWMLLHTLDIVALSLLRFWPLLLVFVGSVVVWQSLRGRRVGATEAGDAVVNAIAILSGVRRGSRARAFRGGELTAFMGGCEIDLREAGIDGEAVIDVFAMWGGIEIRVPESWNVTGEMTRIMGGFEDSTRASGNARTHTLIVRGLVVMGGVEVKN